MATPQRPVALVILDGWGHREEAEHNAIFDAKTPVFDALWKNHPHTLLEASGLAVGLPEGQMGNSEVGHTTIGAGKAIDTDLVRINKACADGSIATNPALVKLFEHVEASGGTLHLYSLLSEGGVHAHQNHLFAIIAAAAKRSIKQIAIHVFTDGRDVAPTAARDSMKRLAEVLEKAPQAFVASVSGRFYAMDRDNNWDRVNQTVDAAIKGVGDVVALDPAQYIEAFYGSGTFDEYIPVARFANAAGELVSVQDGDACFVVNFRKDRVRMLTSALLEHSVERPILVGTMTQYDANFIVEVAFAPEEITTTLAKEVSLAGFTQVHFAETEKFPHAPDFLDRVVEVPHFGEEHVLLASNKNVASHDLAPEMKAAEIADAACEHIAKGVDFTFINFANADMVGHTANHAAIVKGVETVDTALGRVIDAMNAVGGVTIVTADHGNAEQTHDPAIDERHTSHTTNLVPCIVVGDSRALRESGDLTDLAPTVLELLGCAIPEAMTGRVLFHS